MKKADDIHLYRFHPVTGEDAQALLEPDFPRPEGLSDKDWQEGREYIQEAKTAGWLPWWQNCKGEWSRVFDKNLEFVANVLGHRIHKHAKPQN